MLSNLIIKDFRGIKNLSLDNIGQINLLIGKNDSGKSTILEAIYHLFHELCTPPYLSSILTRRTNAFTGMSELFYGYQGKIATIHATYNDAKFYWQLSVDEKRNSLSSHLFQNFDDGRDDRILGSVGYSNNFSLTQSPNDMINRFIGLKLGTFKTLTTYGSNLAFVDCSLKSNTREIERILGTLKITSKDQQFGNILNDIFGKGRDWEFIPHPEDPDSKRAAFKEGGKLKYFADFGDGLRNCVGILGTASNLQDTAMCVEEIESHQHNGSLKKIIRHLVDISRANNIQLFLSTHSMQTWESLHRGIYATDDELEQKEFRCFLVDRDPSTGEVTAESTYDVQKITSALSD